MRQRARRQDYKELLRIESSAPDWTGLQRRFVPLRIETKEEDVVTDGTFAGSVPVGKGASLQEGPHLW